MSETGPATMPAPNTPRLSSAAVGLVATIYIHFLIFAQFGFLQGIRAGGNAAVDIHRVLGAMALAGIAASVIAALVLRRREAKPVGATGFALASIAGGLAGIAFTGPAPSQGHLTVIALLTGAGLGGATVSAAVLLRRFTGGRTLGLHVGAGTGLAYLVCNVPAIFTASPAAKGWISAAAAAGGLLCTVIGRARESASPEMPYTNLTTRAAVAMATLGFLALVWFDSAAFTVVQNSAELRALFWSGPRTLWTVGAVHALAAVAAGLALDRGAMRTVLATAFALLTAGHFGFTFGEAAAGWWSAPVYVAGVSLYSTALAAFAALGPADSGLSPGWRAAWIYSLAGWIGSGAGVGLGEQFGRVPVWAAPAGALVLAAALMKLPPTR